MFMLEFSLLSMKVLVAFEGWNAIMGKFWFSHNHKSFWFRPGHFGFETGQFNVKLRQSWRQWSWQLKVMVVVMWVGLTMRRGGSSQSWTRIHLWSLRIAFWNCTRSSTRPCKAVSVALNWISVFKLRLNRFCAFSTLSWLLVATSFIPYMASYSKKTFHIPTHHDRLRLEEQTLTLSKRENWPEYHEHLWLLSHVFYFKVGNQLYFVPMHFGSSIWILLPFSKEGCPWVWQPVLRCDGGRKVTMDHVHENASLLPLSCNLLGWCFQFLVICHVISDIFIAVFAWPGPHHALRWVWKKLQAHQEEHLERCKTRFKKIKSQKAFVKKLNEIEDHYLVGLIAVFW